MKPNRLRHSVQQQRGMTLVEVVVVIAVAGILAAATAPSVFGAIQRERRRQVANDIANVYREARNQAMSRGQVYMVRIDGDEEFITTDQRIAGVPTRSCRETSISAGFNASTKARYSVSSRASANMIVHARTPVTWVCFEPNGGMTAPFGGSTMTPPAGACPDEQMVIYIADADATGVLTKMACNSPASSYEEVGGHVIRIGRNGEIGLRAPKNG